MFGEQLGLIGGSLSERELIRVAPCPASRSRPSALRKLRRDALTHWPTLLFLDSDGAGHCLCGMLTCVRRNGADCLSSSSFGHPIFLVLSSFLLSTQHLQVACFP